MRIKACGLLLLSAAIAALPSNAAMAQSGDRLSGKQQYEAKCGGCHSIDSSRIGPSHRGVVGRKPGSVKGYSYSKTLKSLGGTWTPARLDKWLAAPQKFAPGSKMYLAVSNATARQDIIAYLQSVSPSTAKK